MTVQTSGSSHLCFEGKPWSRHDSIQFKGKKRQRCVNSLRRGSKRTGLVTFFSCFRFYMRKKLQYKCNTALLKSLRRVSCLNAPLVSFQFRSFFKSLFLNGTSKYQKKCLLQFLYCFPLKIHQHKKWCVQSVMPKLEWTNK